MTSCSGRQSHLNELNFMVTPLPFPSLSILFPPLSLSPPLPFSTFSPTVSPLLPSYLLPTPFPLLPSPSPFPSDFPSHLLSLQGGGSGRRSRREGWEEWMGQGGELEEDRGKGGEGKLFVRVSHSYIDPKLLLNIPDTPLFISLPFFTIMVCLKDLFLL